MKALIVVDMLNDFIHSDENRLIPKTDVKDFINKCRQAIDLAHKKKIQVIYSNLVLTRNNPILKITGECAMKGAQGAQIIPELELIKGDKVSEKGGYDGFWKSGLEGMLKTLRIKDLYIIGTQTDCCVRETGVTAAHLGFNVTLIQDCCKTQDENRHKTAAEFFESAVGKVVQLKDVDW